MFVSIFTDELKLDVPEALPVLRLWGLDRCDLRGRVFGKGCEGLTREELARLHSLLAEHGFRLGAFQSSLCKVHLPDTKRRNDEMKKLEGLVRAADVLGCRLVRSFNCWQPKDPEEKGRLAEQPDKLQLVLDMFAPFAELARREGLVLAFENCGQTPQEVLAFVDALAVPGWGLAWDCANSWDSPERERDEVEYLVKYARRSIMIHVKAQSALGELGGVLPWPRILATCHAAGLNGPVSVETHNPSTSPLDDAEASRRTLDVVRGSWPTAAPGDIYEAAAVSAKPKTARPYEDRPVGFVVVGLGMGHANSKKVVETPGARLVGVCDIREERAKRTGEAFGVPFTMDMEPWLANPETEVVYVVTETGNHASVALRALEAGKHVLITKPMEASLLACDRMIRKAEERGGLILGIDFGRRFSTEALALRQAVKSGFFGRLLAGTAALKILRTQEYYDENGGWRGTKKLDGGGVFSNQAIHDIDTLAFVLGIPARVRADLWTQNHKIEAEDLGCTTWVYPDGAVIHFMATSSFPQQTWHSRVELHGTEGAVVISSGGAEKSSDLWFSNGEWRKDPPIRVEVEWLNAVDNFAAAIRTGAPLVCDGHDGRRSQSILEAMYRSAERGGEWVKVESEIS